MTIQLIHTKEPAAGEQPTPLSEGARYEFNQDEISIGRHNNNDIQFTEAGISRYHSRIKKEGLDYFLLDQGSANGTFLNGVKIPSHDRRLLRDNDIIQIDKHRLVFKLSLEEYPEHPEQASPKTEIVAMRMVKKVLGTIEPQTAPSIEILTGNLKGRVHEFKKEVEELTFGRGTTCDFIIDDNSISRRHMLLRKNRGVVSVVDLNSKNGTLVNGIRVREQSLRDQDTITIGETRILFLNPQESLFEQYQKEVPAPPIQPPEIKEGMAAQAKPQVGIPGADSDILKDIDLGQEPERGLELEKKAQALVPAKKPKVAKPKRKEITPSPPTEPSLLDMSIAKLIVMGGLLFFSLLLLLVLLLILLK